MPVAFTSYPLPVYTRPPCSADVTSLNRWTNGIAEKQLSREFCLPTQPLTAASLGLGFSCGGAVDAGLIAKWITRHGCKESVKGWVQCGQSSLSLIKRELTVSNCWILSDHWRLYWIPGLGYQWIDSIKAAIKMIDAGIEPLASQSRFLVFPCIFYLLFPHH